MKSLENNWSERQVNRAMALILIILIGVVLAYALRPYVNAFLGAFILFVLFRPFQSWLLRVRKWKRSTTAIITLVVSMVVFLMPLSVLTSVIIQESQALAPQLNDFFADSDLVNRWWPVINQRFDLSDQLSTLTGNFRSLFVGTLSAVSVQLISLTIMYFLLYFLLATDANKLKAMIYSLVPFSQDNAIRLANEFRKVTYATLLTTGLIAVIQGCLLSIGFLIFGLPGAFLWGFIGCLAAFIPFLGVPSIWIPTTLFLFFSGRVLPAFGFLAWGVFISNIDNFLRPLIQRKVGSLHPLVSLLGIFIGLSLFGILGIVLGPLLLSYFILILQMFKQEYIK